VTASEKLMSRIRSPGLRIAADCCMWPRTGSSIVTMLPLVSTATVTSSGSAVISNISMVCGTLLSLS